VSVAGPVGKPASGCEVNVESVQPESGSAGTIAVCPLSTLRSYRSG
jgi:hypothetical protein